ncbi:MAG: hypothetical protein IT168_22005 [Bryobacterales bacterium]|nr:hypothetical protein [Bryobacterales bacterium]
MLVEKELVAHVEIARKVAAIERELAGRVIRIAYNLGTDWANEPAVYFRIILSDEASREENLRGITAAVSDRLMNALDHLGLQPYFNFRSESEQAYLNDPAWAA